MRDLPHQPAPSSVMTALSELARHPAQTFFYSWNWKAALLSAMMRAPLFLVATLCQGLEAISVAVLVEAAYSAGISGCYGAFVQKLRCARPLWASGVLILVALPGMLLWLDYKLHLATGMPNLKGGMVAAGILSLLSSLFNWYLMGRGSLLVGVQGGSFGSDLKRLPTMLVDFVSWVPRYCCRLLRSTPLHQQP
jgi:hypothetical protein